MLGENAQYSKGCTESKARRKSSAQREEEKGSRDVVDLNVTMINPQLDRREKKEDSCNKAESRVYSSPKELSD